jgi:hypothetical protein
MPPTGGYAYRMKKTGRRSVPEDKIMMHRELLGLVHLDGKQGDHINRDRLDNRRANLRVVTSADNSRNTGSRRNSSSKYRGVCLRDGSRWVAQATFEGHNNYLGSYKIEEEAARVVNAFWVERGYEAPNDLPQPANGPESCECF